MIKNFVKSYSFYNKFINLISLNSFRDAKLKSLTFFKELYLKKKKNKIFSSNIWIYHYKNLKTSNFLKYFYIYLAQRNLNSFYKKSNLFITKLRKFNKGRLLLSRQYKNILLPF